MFSKMNKFKNEVSVGGCRMTGVQLKVDLSFTLEIKRKVCVLP